MSCSRTQDSSNLGPLYLLPDALIQGPATLQVIFLYKKTKKQKKKKKNIGVITFSGSVCGLGRFMELYVDVKHLFRQQ